MVNSTTTDTYNFSTNSSSRTTHKCRGGDIPKMRKKYNGKSKIADGSKLATATKRKKHANVIKAIDDDGTILKKKQTTTTAHNHENSRLLHRKQPGTTENSVNAALDYLESMVQELMRLLTVVRYIFFIYHAQQHIVPK